MKKDRMLKLGLAVVFSLTLATAGCGGGGGGGDAAAANPDTDGDGIPNAVDAFPNDPTKFVNNVTVLLAGLSAGGAGFTAATAVNTGGSVVGFSEVTAAPAGVKAVRWTVSAVDGSASPAATLNPISAGGTYSAAYGVSTAGITVGESESGAGGSIVAAFWPASAVSGATALPAGTFPGPSSAYGINSLATPQIVGEATNAGGVLRAVLWNGTTGTPVDLGSLAGATGASSAYAINDNGIVVGESETATGVTHAAAWLVSGGTKSLGPVDLGVITVADTRSIAFGVDSTGLVVGESEAQDGTVHAGLWTLNPATLVPSLKKDLGANATAYAINDSSRIAGQLGATDVATVWDTRNVALPNGAVVETTFSQGLGMNNGNVIVGTSGTATGARAFVAIPR